MIAPRIDHHVFLRGHMAFDALRARRAGLVEVMLFRVECRSVVAAYAQSIALRTEIQRVRLMAVHAGNAALEHSALQERAPGIDLVALLPIGVIIRLREHCQPVRFFERRAGLPAVDNR